MFYRIFHRTGWWLLLILCLIPVVRWGMLMPIGDRLGTPILVYKTIGQVTGIIGLELFAFNLLLATRIKFFEDLFGGLNRVFIAHHIIGGLALIGLMIHPLSLALMYVPSGFQAAAMFLLPTTDNLPLAYGIIGLAGMLFLLILTFFVKLPYHIWLWTHKFLGVFFFLSGLHVLLIPSSLSADVPLASYLLGFCLLGILAFIYRTLLPNIFIRRFDYMVNSAKVVAPGTVQIDLVPLRQAMNFKAGQFVFISFRHKGISPEYHPFSISEAPGKGDFTITVKSLGTYTKALSEALPQMTGVHAKVEGAYGRFSYQNIGNPNQIWIAGGIGVTPFLSMAKALGPEPHQIDLYYSARSVTELVELNELRSRQSQIPGNYFRLIPFVGGGKQRLTADFINQTSAGLAGKDILLCGPPPMMKSLRQQLRALGVPNKRIHSEEFSMS